MNSPRPRLAIALGDPAGIGPEVVLKALADPAMRQNCEITLVGNEELLRRSLQQLPSHFFVQTFQDSSSEPFLDPSQDEFLSDWLEKNELTLLDVPLEDELMLQIVPGVGNAASGEASFRSLKAAIALCLIGECHGVVTAPIAKSAWKAAGHDYPGQTELLAEMAEVDRFGMLFVARSPHTNWTLRTLLATTHIPLRQVPDALNSELMTRKLELLMECLQVDFGLTQPSIAIAGLNPHSGEQGQLGREEVEWLGAWVKEMGDRFPHSKLSGPVPPDTLWVSPGQAWFGGSGNPVAHDAYLALYHDQGLIPVKLMAFDRAVNTTVGLPFVRTSPDHGTAFDIAGQGVADSRSMKSAIALAVELVEQRLRNN